MNNNNDNNKKENDTEKAKGINESVKQIIEDELEKKGRGGAWAMYV